MAVSAKKRKELVLRRKIVKRLFTMGLSRDEVANALSIDSGSADNDLRRLGGMAAFPAMKLPAVERRTRAFAAALKRYAGMHGLSESAILDAGERQALARYLDLSRIQAAAEGIAAVVRRMIHPNDPKRYENYRHLLHAIFKDAPETVSGEVVLARYFDAVKEKRVGLPRRKALVGAIGKSAFEEWQGDIRLPIDEAGRERLEKALGFLQAQEEKVLRMRFGLVRDGFHRTQEEIGEHLGLSPIRIRQLEARGLEKLRHPARSRDIRFLALSPAEIAARRLLETKPMPAPRDADLTEKEILAMPVERLTISIHLEHCLAHMNLRTVGDIVQCSETDLLGSTQFGPGSLRELKAVLRDLGQSLRKP